MKLGFCINLYKWPTFFGKHFQNDEEVEPAVKTWFTEQAVNIYGDVFKNWIGKAYGKCIWINMVVMLGNRNKNLGSENKFEFI